MPAHRTEYVTAGSTNCFVMPEGVAVELADLVIRVADLCGFYGIDLEAVIRMKMEYNSTRPKMHGKTC